MREGASDHNKLQSEYITARHLDARTPDMRVFCARVNAVPTGRQDEAA